MQTRLRLYLWSHGEAHEEKHPVRLTGHLNLQMEHDFQVKEFATFNWVNNFKGLEAIMQQESYNVIAITETWWDDSHDWSAAMDGHKLFRRDRHGWRGGGVALYVRECLDSVELECLWIRIGGKANKADILMGVCYRPPNQDDEGDELFYKQLANVSKSPALVLVGNFNLPDIRWELNTAEKRQSKRFLECIEDNFLLQLVKN
ncbi:mitochondrial fission process protein 1 [Pitangus sulphuratus]|nr:mitochondrial fission process protein 1 [Pitangus sulphuratus]